MTARVVGIVGPTAVGKTAMALRVGPWVDAEVISADSRQVYRGLDIGTAKPTSEEQRQLRHHGLDLVGPGERFDVARYRHVAIAAIEDIVGRQRAPVLVGGTGLYVRALVSGLCHVPPIAPAVHEAIDADMAARGAPALHDDLGRLDPVAAARIHPNDAVRILRAVEVAVSTGRPLSSWQGAHGFAERRFDTLLLGLTMDAEALEARIARRFDQMMAAGFLDEVSALVRGVAPDAPAWRTVGYREVRRLALGENTLAEARLATVRATRQFAKRQRTWFRREPDVYWLDPERDGARLAEIVEAFVSSGRRPPADGSRTL